MTDASLGLIEDGAIAATGGRIAWLGREAELPAGHAQMARDVVSCHGAWLTPGLIDCHTTSSSAGTEPTTSGVGCGASPTAEIARAGGGIMSTVRPPARPHTTH